MSAQDLEAPPNMYSRNRVKRKPMIDLSAALPDLNLGQEGTSTDQGVHVYHLNAAFPDSYLGQEGTSIDQGVHVDHTSNQVGVPGPSTPINPEMVDNDVIISSPRTFAEAKSNSMMNRGRPIVVDVESADWVPVKNNKRRRTGPNRTFINYDLVINLEGSSSSKSIVPPPAPPPKDTSFSCPVCMGSLVEETSTKCGHIFCKRCIRAAITAQNKCPACRRKVLMKDLIRVYLPATS